MRKEGEYGETVDWNERRKNMKNCSSWKWQMASNPKREILTIKAKYTIRCNERFFPLQFMFV